MIDVTALSATALGEFLAADFRRTFGGSHGLMAELLQGAGQIAIECIGNSDALYHDVEHTLLVTLAGRDILRGRALHEPVDPVDWLHFLIACLTHDIGYVRGVLKGDRPNAFIVDAEGRTVSLPRGASDAALTLYHVDRSKLFVLERFGASGLLDARRLAHMIEFTRFPAPRGPNDPDLDDEAGLLRAADLVGQLGDPSYLRKANALYWEFAETGTNTLLGYTSPADIVEHYPAFFWEKVSEYIDPAVRHLNVTMEGRRWIASLHANIFGAQHGLRLRGPQP
jgi:hypothetical protein